VANKPDSQEICFVPDNDYRAYLREHAPDCLIPGEVVDTAGRVLARHEGLAGFTIGQRKGLGLSGGGRPLYVVALDPARGQVVVGDREALAGRTLVADDVVAGRLSEADLAAPVRVTAQIRANMAPQPAIAQITDGRLAVAFDAPQRAITPGQAVVCYLGDAVACGGTISVSLCPSVSL
jgi:tRNA-specific 2-thiouridylase